ncbi:MAG TPA: hypothetical protein VGO04_30000 [Ensifer sp.]|jgi:tetratricopeptide (TPR) repeat protein|uniref:tetratricopeptide repeat protein n=1 Tax=Ensifer sp. TaxID=1872086 RepID=UPI002E14F3F1|nr:hypothetical protein [Ensifer sp.]
MEASRNAGQVVCSTVAESEARIALERILADGQFHATERHRKLLRYLVDEFFAGRSSQVKAYTIAIDVFGRPTSFDPATDPIVRVEASRLRAALAQYYETLGEKAELRIELPKGNYVPQFVLGGGPPSGGLLSNVIETAAPPVEAASEPVPELPVEPAVPPATRAALGSFLALGAGVVVMAAAFYASVVDRLPWQPLLSAKPTIVVDVPTVGGIDDDAQRKAGDYLVHALSQFSAVRTLAQPPAGVDVASVTGWVSSSSPVKLQGSKEYRLSIAYSTDNRGQEVSWQVIDAESNEALRAGTSKAATERGDARELQEKLLSRLALSLAGEEGVIVSLEAARQLTSPSIGFGCVLLADVALARFEPEALATARACLEQSLSYQAADPDVLASLAMVLVATGEARATERAMKLADKAVALAPQSSQSYVSQMQARFAAGDTDAAFMSGRRAAALNPLDDAIPARLGLLLFVSGQYSDGLGLAQAAEAGGEYLHHDAALTLALDDYRNGRYRDALRRARQLANPADIAVNLLRMAAAGQLGLTREATSAFDGLRWSKVGATRPVEKELAARGYAPDLIALLSDGLGKAGINMAALP